MKKKYALVAACLCLLLSISLSRCASQSPLPQERTGENMPKCEVDRKYIGVAILDDDSTMRVFLWSTEKTHGGAMLKIYKDNPYFDKVVKHIDGELKVGEYLYIKPMCDEER